MVIGLMEGLDALRQITSEQSSGFAQQRAMNAFMSDVQAATWFYNGETHDETGAMVLNETASPYVLTLGYPGPDGDEIWVRYRARSGVFYSWTGETQTYLVRTVISASGLEEGSTIIATGVANLLFDYEDQSGGLADFIPDTQTIGMTLSIDINGSAVRREYIATMRNPNQGVKYPPGDFDEVESDYFSK
jgi:hypothetical protein